MFNAFSLAPSDCVCICRDSQSVDRLIKALASYGLFNIEFFASPEHRLLW